MTKNDFPEERGSRLLLAKIINQLRAEGVDFAIIHTAEDSYLDTSSDIDIAFNVDPRKVLEPIMEKLESQGDVRVIQCLHYEVPYGFYYILSPSDIPLDFLHLDCLFDPYGINRYHLSTQFLLHNIDHTAWYPRVNIETQAIYLLIKRVIKNKATAGQISRIRAVLRSPMNPWRICWIPFVFPSRCVFI
jgi:hypothetical protein